LVTTAFKQHDWGVWAVGALTAIVTAFYMTRVMLLTFFGEYRGAAHPHEAPRVMLAPMVVLAALSCVAGFLGPTHLFADWVHFGPQVREPFDYGFAALSLIGAAIGIVVGYSMFLPMRTPNPLSIPGASYLCGVRRYLLAAPL